MNDGGPAFPFPSGPEPRVNEFHERCEGMSLRDWFATHATQDDINEHRKKNNYANETFSREEARYRYADAMILQRAIKQNPK